MYENQADSHIIQFNKTIIKLSQEANNESTENDIKH